MAIFSPVQVQALYVLPMISGSISLLGSGTIATMILISVDRLSYPFRRLIFGLSIMDIIQSIAMIMGPFSLPANIDGVLWSKGNVTTCDIQGFALHIGFAGVPMYMLSLSVYYLYSIKFNMKDKVFSRKIEPWLHAGSICWTLLGGIACWATGSFNMMEAGNICWYTPSPYDCVANDDVECDRGKHAFTFGWIFGGSNFLTLCGIIYCLYGVCRTVIDQEERNDRYRFRGSVHVTSEPAASRRESMMSTITSAASTIRRVPSLLRQSFNSDAIVEPPLDDDQTMRRSTLSDPNSYVQRMIEKSNRRKREARVQASLYVYAFLFTCTWAYLYGFLVTIGVSVPYTIIVLFSTFYPLGGFFNILVYCRPKINSVRKKSKGLSWTRSFWLVVRAGGEVPSSIPLASSSVRGSITLSAENEENKPKFWERRFWKRCYEKTAEIVDTSTSINNEKIGPGPLIEMTENMRRRSSIFIATDEAFLSCLEEDSEFDEEEEAKEEVQSSIKEWRSMLPDRVSSTLSRSVHKPKELGEFLNKPLNEEERRQGEEDDNDSYFCEENSEIAQTDGNIGTEQTGGKRVDFEGLVQTYEASKDQGNCDDTYDGDDRIFEA